MERVYIVAAKRSAIGSMLGSLANVAPSDLGAAVVKEMLNEKKIKPQVIDGVIVGNVLSAGVGQGLARQISIKAGVGDEVCAYSVNMVCGSGMKAVMNAVNDIRSGFSRAVIAGGVEVMSQAPYILANLRQGIKMGDFTTIDHMIKDSLTDAFSNVHMGITAENIAEKYRISRNEQDEFAINSQKKAIAAVDGGKFTAEIAPVEVKIGKNLVVFDKDEYPNRTSTLEKLSGLKPAFKKDGGTVTAGNSSGINDGASFVLVMSESACKEHSLTPLAEIISFGQGGVDPQFMGLGPVPAIRNALKPTNLKLSDIDVLELNEAFAAQSLGVITELAKEHGISKEDLIAKTNVNGGAISLGHPVGASGNRIIVSLLYEMLSSKKPLGLASLCIGGGMGTAIILSLAK